MNTIFGLMFQLRKFCLMNFKSQMGKLLPHFNISQIKLIGFLFLLVAILRLPFCYDCRGLTFVLTINEMNG